MEPKINKGERKMAKLKLTANNILTCVLYVVIGALLCFAQGEALKWITIAIGVLFLAYGIYDLVKGHMVNGIIEAVVGVVILVCGFTTLLEWGLLVFGVLLIIKGVIDLIDSLKSGWKSMLAPIVMIVVGILLAFTKFAADVANILLIVAGVILIINGILALFGKKL